MIIDKEIPLKLFEPCHEISNNVVCATSKGSAQPAHMPVHYRFKDSWEVPFMCIHILIEHSISKQWGP